MKGFRNSSGIRNTVTDVLTESRSFSSGSRLGSSWVQEPGAPQLPEYEIGLSWGHSSSLGKPITLKKRITHNLGNKSMSKYKLPLCSRNVSWSKNRITGFCRKRKNAHSNIFCSCCTSVKPLNNGLQSKKEGKAVSLGNNSKFWRCVQPQQEELSKDAASAPHVHRGHVNRVEQHLWSSVPQSHHLRGNKRTWYLKKKKKHMKRGEEHEDTSEKPSLTPGVRAMLKVWILARPKSAILISPRLLTRMFSGFKSRCRTRFVCRKSSPRSSCCITSYRQQCNGYFHAFGAGMWLQTPLGGGGGCPTFMQLRLKPGAGTFDR